MKQKIKQLNQQKITTSLLALGFLLLAFPVFASEITPQNVIELVNEARRSQGVEQLVPSDKLTTIAKQKAKDMIENEYFSHTSPKGITPWHWFEVNGYDYKVAGENLAINFVNSEDQQRAWMDSPTHKKNILNSSFKEIGVAVAAGKLNGKMGLITVQEFGTLKATTGADQKEEQKFFMEGDPKVVPEKIDLKPSVLSAKDVSLSQQLPDKKTTLKQIAARNNIPLRDGLVEAQNFFSAVLLVVLFLPILLVQLTVGLKFFQPLWVAYRPAVEYQVVNVSDPRAYLEKLERRGVTWGRARRIKVVRSG